MSRSIVDAVPQAAPRRRLWAAALLTAVGFGLYARALNVPFVFDDRPAIVDNVALRSLWGGWRAPPDTPLAGRPAVALSLALNYQLSAMQVRSYHVVNAALHVGSALLLMSLVSRTLAGRGAVFAFLVALLWLVHPLQTEAVVYISQRTELLMAFCLLATLYAARRARESSHTVLWQAVAVVACAVGMASKEVMVVAPVLVVLYDRTFLFETDEAAWRARWPLYACLGATWMILAALVAGEPRSATAGFATGVSSWVYLLTQVQVIWWYLRLAVWPHPLSISYHWPLVTSLADVWAAALPIVLGLLAALLGLWRRSVTGFLGVAFFLLLAPTSSVVPIATEIAAERRMYLPLAVLVVLGALPVLSLHRRLAPGRSRAVVCAVGALAIALGAATVVRLGAWQTEAGLWRDVLVHHPDNPTAWTNLGAVLIVEGDAEGAARALGRSRVLRPHHLGTLANLALVQRRLGREREAVSTLGSLLSLDPDHLEALRHLGALHLSRDDAEAARTCYRRLVERAPDDAAARRALGHTLTRLDRFAEAEQHLERALALEPGHADVHNFLGILCARTDRLARAGRHFRAAVGLRPDHADARANLERVRELLSGGEASP